MRDRRIARIVLFWSSLALLAGDVARGQSPKRPANPLVAKLVEQIEATQLRVDRVLVDGRSNFRATIIEVGADQLVLLTGAHCVPDLKPGDVLQLSIGGEAWDATVARVVINPSYRQDTRVAGPGPDSAIVRLNVPASTKGWESARKLIRAAELTAEPGVRSKGEVVSVLVIDQDGVYHVVKAANFRNPRWIEWGRELQLRPGDSGSGVFIAKADPRGGARPVLVGSVSVRDLEGGGGTLVWRRDRWVAETLSPRP